MMAKAKYSPVAYRRRIHIHGLPTTWLGRLLVVVVAAAMLILAFFFLSFVLIAVGVMILAALVRLLLPTHKTRGQTSDGAIEGAPAQFTDVRINTEDA